jgi:hypothetical protein
VTKRIQIFVTCVFACVHMHCYFCICVCAHERVTLKKMRKVQAFRNNVLGKGDRN